MSQEQLQGQEEPETTIDKDELIKKIIIVNDAFKSQLNIHSNVCTSMTTSLVKVIKNQIVMQ